MSVYRYDGAVWSLVIDTGWDTSIPGGLAIAPDTSLALEICTVGTEGWYQSVDDGVTWGAWSDAWGVGLTAARGCCVIEYTAPPVPPYVDNRDPAPDEIGVAVTHNVSFDLKDDDDDLNPAAVTIAIDGVIAYELETEQPGFTVTRTPITHGYHYSVSHSTPFPYDWVVSIYVYAEDTGARSVTDEWSFTTEPEPETPPYVDNEDPAPDEVDVAVTHSVSFDIWDNEDDLNLTSVKATIDGILAYVLEAQQPGFTVTRTPITHGYHYSVSHSTPFPYSHLTPVEVYAEDLGARSVTRNWSFTTESEPLPPTYGPVAEQKGINFDLGSEISFMGQGWLNGKYVISPIVLNKPGYFILDTWNGVVASRLCFAVVDVVTLRVRLLGLTSLANNESFRRQVGDMPKTYKMSKASRPLMGYVAQDIGFYANAPVAVTIQLVDKITGEMRNISKGMADSEGVHVVKGIIPAGGIVDLRVKIVIAPTPYIVGVTEYEAWGDGDWGHVLG